MDNMSGQDWQALTRLTGTAAIQVERVRVVDPNMGDVVIEGRFDLPPLARLSAEDQVFVAAFVRSHGSIKQMERYFGVSYPTIKNRLNRLSAQLPFVEVEPPAAPARAGELLERLERGEMTAKDVVHALKSHSEGREP
jgi:hypothetical protein